MAAFIPICNCDREYAAQAAGSDGISTIGVGSGSSVMVSVGGAIGDEVCVGTSVGVAVFVGGMDVWVGETAFVVGGSGVDVIAGKAGCADPSSCGQINNRNMISRMIATTNLKRS